MHPSTHGGHTTPWYIPQYATLGTPHPLLYYRRHVRGWDQCGTTMLWAQEGEKAWVGGLPFPKSPKGVRVVRETVRRVAPLFLSLML